VLIAEPFVRHLSAVSRAVERSFVVTAPVVDRARYLAELREIVQREGVDLVVPISEEILHVADLHGTLPATCRLYSMPAAMVRAVHHKGQFVEICRAAGIDAPETYAADDPAAAALAARSDYVIKPVAACSGRGVFFFDCGQPLPSRDEAFRMTGGLEQPVIVQQRVQGDLVSSFSIARRGEVQSTVLYRGAVMQGTVAVCFERIEIPPAVEQWIRRFVAHTGFDGFISFDLIIDAEGRPQGIECNPRATSGIHFVDPRYLASVLLAPEQTSVAALRPEPLMQQFFPCLTETQKSMFTSRFAHNFRCLREAREVTWDARDPWPFIGMPYTAWNIIALAARQRMTFGEVAMLDFATVAAARSQDVQ
jgi:biotin carboxylase